MKKLIAAALVTASLAGASMPAFAGEGEGVVASVDAVTRTIMLEDGSTWTVAEDVDISALAPGAKIKVTYDDGTTNVTALETME